MKNILIIEDDRMLNKGVAFALKKDGYNTMCAYTKEESKNLIQHNEVDFLLLDIGLPDGSGLDLCNEIKEKIDFPIVPFGICTSKLSAIVAPISAKLLPVPNWPWFFIDGEYAKNGTYSLVWSLPL